MHNITYSKILHFKADFIDFQPIKIPIVYRTKKFRFFKQYGNFVTLILAINQMVCKGIPSLLFRIKQRAFSCFGVT